MINLIALPPSDSPAFCGVVSQALSEAVSWRDAAGLGGAGLGIRRNGPESWLGPCLTEVLAIGILLERLDFFVKWWLCCQ